MNCLPLDKGVALERPSHENKVLPGHHHFCQSEPSVIEIMTKKIILHIGIHKTGTSSIQQFLTTNRDLLEVQGIFYPKLRDEWNNHNPLAWHLMDSKYEPSIARYYKKYGSEKHWRTLFDAVAKDASNTVLLSGEDFSLVQDPARLADLCKSFDTRIIVYLRRQDQLLQSLYNQDVKDHAWMCSQTLDQFFCDHRLNDLIHYELFLSRWASAFGRENLSIGMYDKARLDQGLISDFAGRAGISVDASFDIQNVNENPSLLPFDLELKRILNGIGISVSENEILLEAIRVSRKSCRAQPKFIMHQGISLSKRTAFVKMFHEGNRKVAKEFLKEDSLLFSAVESDGDSDVYERDGDIQLERDVVPLVLELLRRASNHEQREVAAGEKKITGALSPDSVSLDVPFSKEALTEASGRLFQLPESAQDDENLYSMSNYASVYLPLLERIKPKRIVEIGVEHGGNTTILEKFCLEKMVELHLVDTFLRPGAATSGSALIHHHQARSVDFLADFKGAEVYFIDADHNYKSVFAELELIEQAHDGEAPLLVILHDTGWPCAFRDCFYKLTDTGSGQNTISVDKGPVPWRSDLLETGFGANFFGWNDREGGVKNGVSTAIEDFAGPRNGWNRAYFTPFYGVCFLWYEPSFSAEQQQYINEMTSIPKQLEPIFATLEWNRVLLYLKIQKLVAETRYAGDLWQKQQDWIQHLEGKLREM